MLSAMASTAEAQDYKTVTGYPAPPAGEVAAGYPAATAYPYAAPPAYPPTAPPLPDDDRSLRRSDNVICVLFLFIGLVILLTFLFVPPHPEIRVDSATVSALNVTGSELTATCHLTLLITNPTHKSRMQYDRLQASLFYGHKDDVDDDDHVNPLLGTTSLGPFVIDKGNQTRVDLKLVTVNQYVGDDVAKKISDDKVEGWVTFTVWVRASVRLGSGPFGCWAWWPYLLRVSCYPVEFGFSPNNNGTGSFTGQSKKCQVVFWWYF